jgi:hypothetical protein
VTFEEAITWLDEMENEELIAANHTTSPTVEARRTKRAKAWSMAIELMHVASLDRGE